MNQKITLIVVFLLFVTFFPGCTKSPDTQVSDFTPSTDPQCKVLGESCCINDICSKAEVLCVEGTKPVFLGCNDNCNAQATCE